MEGGRERVPNNIKLALGIGLMGTSGVGRWGMEGVRLGTWGCREHWEWGWGHLALRMLSGTGTEDMDTGDMGTGNGRSGTGDIGTGGAE